MAKIKFPKRENWFTVFSFQLCVIANDLFDKDPQLYLVAKIITAFFFGVVLFHILQRGKIRYNHILLLPIIFTLYCAATIFWATSPNRAMTQMITQVQLLLLALFTFWVMNDGVTTQDYMKALYISGFSMAVFAMIRYGGLTQYTEAMLRGERMGDEITNQNTFGIIFGNAALCSTYFFMLKKKRIHIFSFVIFCFFAFSSGSKKALLMVLAGVIMMAALNYGWRRLYRTVLVVAAIVFFVVLALQLPYFKKIADRLQDLFAGGRDESTMLRQELINFGIRLFKERPIFGYGIGNFQELHISGVYSHNNYIELLTSGGVIALIVYYLMILLPVINLLKNRKKRQKISDIQLMLLIWVAIELLFGVALVQIYSKKSWILIGVLLATTSDRNQQPVLQEKINESDQEN